MWTASNPCRFRQLYYIGPEQGLRCMHEVRARNHLYLCFVVRGVDGLVCSKFQITISFSITFMGYFFRIGSFFHMSWRRSHLVKHLYMLLRWCSTCQKSPWSLFSSLLTLIHPHILQRPGNHRTHGVV